MPDRKKPRSPKSGRKTAAPARQNKQNVIDITTSWMMVNQLAGELMHKLKTMIYCHNPAVDGWDSLFAGKENSIVQLQKLADVMVKITDRIDTINRSADSVESAATCDVSLKQEDMEMLKDWLEGELQQLDEGK